MTRILILLLSLLATPALAHKASDSYLALQASGQHISGRWDIALRDLDQAIGLDANQDGQLSWGEVRAQHVAISRYALARLQLQNDGADCPLRPGAQQLIQHVDGVYSTLALQADCPSNIGKLSLRYALLFDIDPSHRGLASVAIDGISHSLLFAPDKNTQQIAGRSWSDTATEFIRQGVQHIWSGYDHILFLLSLLLPSVLVWQASRWQASDSLRQSLLEVARIVTAFTLAHSITLTLATLGLVSLNSRLVESAIAASVILAALNNIWPIIGGKRWLVAFGFGLIHGFGFASVLAELQLPGNAIALALGSFNIGVELGQLVIVLLFVPVAFLLRRQWLYQRLLLGSGSALVAILASLWLYERAFDVALF